MHHAIYHAILYKYQISGAKLIREDLDECWAGYDYIHAAYKRSHDTWFKKPTGQATAFSSVLQAEAIIQYFRLREKVTDRTILSFFPLHEQDCVSYLTVSKWHTSMALSVLVTGFVPSLCSTLHLLVQKRKPVNSTNHASLLAGSRKDNISKLESSLDVASAATDTDTQTHCALCGAQTPVDAIKDYFGHSAGLYFSFISHLNSWLGPYAFICVVMQMSLTSCSFANGVTPYSTYSTYSTSDPNISDVATSPSVLLCLTVLQFAGICWGFCMIVGWRRQQQYLDVMWGRYGIGNSETFR